MRPFKVWSSRGAIARSACSFPFRKVSLSETFQRPCGKFSLRLRFPLLSSLFKRSVLQRFSQGLPTGTAMQESLALPLLRPFRSSLRFLGKSALHRPFKGHAERPPSFPFGFSPSGTFQRACGRSCSPPAAARSVLPRAKTRRWPARCPGCSPRWPWSSTASCRAAVRGRS